MISRARHRLIRRALRTVDRYGIGLLTYTMYSVYAVAIGLLVALGVV